MRSGIDLIQLRGLLRADHIRLQYEQGYRSDIAKLKKHTTDSRDCWCRRCSLYSAFQLATFLRASNKFVNQLTRRHSSRSLP